MNETDFWSRAEVGDDIACWEWKSGTRRRGYGRYHIKRKGYCAHRISFELFKGSIPKGMLVLHRCDNPSCINPSHLFLGTSLDNSRDMVSKNRQAKGELCGKSKLTWEQVSEIRSLRGLMSLEKIALMHGVTLQNIHCIQTNKTWKSSL